MGAFRQGGNLGFQSTAGFGIYFTEKVSISAYILHFCSAGLNGLNKGMTIPIISGGASF